MFVQALAEYADRALPHQLGDVAFEEKGVLYLIELDQNGRFLNSTERMAVAANAARKTAKARPEPLLIPRSPVPRNAGLHPLLAADDIKYVLGQGAWTEADDKENHEERFGAFTELIARAAAETNDSALEACRRFYATPEEVEKARQALSAAKPGSIVALSVNGPVVLRAAVQDYWRQHYRQASGARTANGPQRECLISGRLGPVEPTHPKIKHAASIGGQPSGVSLMSFDKEAFRSYGWDQCANSPVSTDRAMAYVLALNDLLTPGGRHRRDFNNIAFIFWTRREEGFDPISLLTQAKPEQVQDLLNFSRTADPDPDQFYMAALSANGGRLILRSWITETLPNVKANLQKWFEGVRVQPLSNGRPQAAPFWQLLQAIDREGDPPANRTLSLLRRAVEGAKQPLGYQMLNAVLARLRVDHAKRLNPAALGLVRLCVNDVNSSFNQGEAPMTESIDVGNKHPAYLCGRLLAVYESLQYAAFSAANESKVNVTVADRYYDLASTSPQIAFPKIVELGRKHLQKLRRLKGGLAWKIESEIAGLQQEIEGVSGFAYPAMLSLDGQGRFALGYYHQRAKQFHFKTNGNQPESAESQEQIEQ
jgi:CRISPR-associated protein Csd1